MSIPGSNLLNMAFSLIAAQRVGWRAYLGKIKNPAGVQVATWADPVDIFGSFQPIDSKLLQQYGLDMTKSYVTFYASQGFTDVERDKTGDRLIYGGEVYQIESKCPWLLQDGWSRVLCIKVTNATA